MESLAYRLLGRQAMQDLLRDPYSHAGACQVCPACGMPEIPSVDCLCVEPTEPVSCCVTCGAEPGDYGATCDECRLMGRVDSSLARFLDRELVRKPPSLPEEPLPTVRPSAA